jgi:hypothetical protein
VALTILLDPGVLCRELMPATAMSEQVDVLVLTARDGSQMFRVDTQFLPTVVMNEVPLGDLSMRLLPREAVRIPAFHRSVLAPTRPDVEYALAHLKNLGRTTNRKSLR